MNPYRTPASNKRRRVSSPPSSRFLRGVDTLAEMAATAAGYGNTYKVGRKLINRVRKSIRGKIQEKKQETEKVSTVKRPVGSTKAAMKGKLYGPQKKVKGPTIKKLKGFKLANAAVSIKFENRFEDTGSVANESQIVGHGTLPVSQVAFNTFRALIKKIFAEKGVHISSFTDGCGVFVNWNIAFYFYPEWMTPNTTAPSSVNNVIPALGDWNQVVYNMANNLAAISFDFYKVRWLFVRLLNPSSGIEVEMNLEYMYFQQKSKSLMKVQNQSLATDNVETPAGADQDTDVHNVPIQGHCYYVTGNQLIHFRAKKAVPVGGNGTYYKEEFATNAINSEPRPAKEYVNCTGRSSFILDPGDIKTSIISHNGIYKWTDIMRQCYVRANSGVGQDSAQDTYRKFGHTRFMHFDKVIGKTGTRISLAGECQYELTTACYTTANRIIELVIGQAP